MRRFLHPLLGPSANIRRYSVNALAPTIHPYRAPFTPSNPSTKTLKYVNRFLDETSDPTWHIVQVLHSPRPPTEFLNTFRDQGLPQRSFLEWMDVIYEYDAERAIHLLKSRGYTVGGFGDSLPTRRTLRPPIWVLLYIVSSKVHTAADASGPLLDIFQSWFHTLPTSFQPHLIILVMAHLSRFKLLVPMRQMTKCFLTTPIEESPELYFNLFLQALSSSPERSVELANLILDVLKAMEARQLKLSSSTYHALLNDRFVTLQLTKYLHQRMAREGFVPNTAHFEAYLRIFAKGGSIHDAERYRTAIHAEAVSSPNDLTKDAVHRANTTLLAAQEDKASAFNFLQRLLDTDGIDITTDITPAASDTEPSSIDHPNIHPITQYGLNIYSYSAMLTVVARDRTNSPAILLKLFDRVFDSGDPALQPTTTTYTIVMRGLYCRKAMRQAGTVWRKFLHRSRLPMDSEALTIGLQIWTRMNKPHEAFAKLENCCRPPLPGEEPDRPVRLTTIGINEFLVSLNRIARPDMVFKLWDHMIPLYSIYPNSTTLSILLQSARLATKLDDSLAGAMDHFAWSVRNRLKVQQPVDIDTMTREDRVQSIRQIVGHPQAEDRDPRRWHNGTPSKPYKSGIWNGEDPFDRVRKIFWEVMVGCHPHLLEQVELPARAIRTALDADPMRTFGLPKMGYVDPSFTPSESLLAPSPQPAPQVPTSAPDTDLTPSEDPSSISTLTYPEDFDLDFDVPEDLADDEDKDQAASNTGILPDSRRSRHPQISLTNANCLNYIALLGVTSNVPEIPLVLAWMRASGIQPSRSTIALALVLWAEVSIPVPIIESLQRKGYGYGNAWGTKGQGGKNEYEKLIEWIEDWVGKKRMPTHERIEKWHNVVTKMRDTKAPTR